MVIIFFLRHRSVTVSTPRLSMRYLCTGGGGYSVAMKTKNFYHKRTLRGHLYQLLITHISRCPDRMIYARPKVKTMMGTDLQSSARYLLVLKQWAQCELTLGCTEKGFSRVELGLTLHMDCFQQTEIQYFSVGIYSWFVLHRVQTYWIVLSFKLYYR